MTTSVDSGGCRGIRLADPGLLRIVVRAHDFQVTPERVVTIKRVFIDPAERRYRAGLDEPCGTTMFPDIQGSQR
jgi:hypothetical protein